MKRLKYLLIFIAVLLFLLLAFWVYFQTLPSKHLKPLQAMNRRAVMVIETDNLTSGWKEIKNSDLWESLLEGDYFDEYEGNLLSFDSLMVNNSLFRSLFNNRPLALSVQMLNDDYDFLFAVDIGKYGQFSVLPQLAGLFNYDVKERLVDSLSVYTLTYDKPEDVIHLAVFDNLLIGSFSSNLLSQSIRTLQNGKGFQINKFSEVERENGAGLVNFHLNYRELSAFSGYYSKDLEQSLSHICKVMGYSSFVAELKDKNINLSGYTNYYDTVPSIIHALMKSTPGIMEAHRILPAKTALLMDLSVTNFQLFYADFLKQLRQVDSLKYKEYTQNIKRVEDWLDVDFNEVLFSWLDGELALAKLCPESNAREMDALFALKANNINLAKEQLSILLQHIKKRTPVKFDQIPYRNHQIHLLHMKGFFKLFIGGLMEGVDKPYFTFMDNYVVFSNSADHLMRMIDDFLVGNTLSRMPTFDSFYNRFESNSSFSVFVQMPRVYQHLFYYSDAKARASLKNNKKLLVNFANIGWQLRPKGLLFATSLMAQHDEKALLYQELEEMENSAEDLFVEDFRELKFKIVPNEYFPWTEGHVDYWVTHPERVQDSIVLHDGVMRDSLLQGLWRTYYASGNIKAAVPYEDGLVDGTALFYYDEALHPVKSEAVFDEDVMNEEYKEFYSNGRLKADLEMEDGLFEGDATFYYQNGQIKIEGRYKNGLRHGKWKHYTATGELIEKETWHNGKD